MKENAQFYFANLGADVVRCATAAEAGDEGRYKSSLERARRTLEQLRDTKRMEAHEEGVRMIQGLEYARSSGNLSTFKHEVDNAVAPFASRFNPIQ